MSVRVAPETYQHMSSLVFLCPECGGDLRRTSGLFAGDPLWQCTSCGRTMIWMSAGWGVIPGERALHVE